MSMTKEEAIEYFKMKVSAREAIGNDIGTDYEAYKIALTALRPITREQVEKGRGEWVIEDAGDGDRRKKCSMCNQPISGWWGRDRFCANCGSPMTDEAVDMVMKRIEEGKL